MYNLREEAKAYRKNMEYHKAAEIYKNIIKDCEIENLDKWLGWEYADTLKRIGYLDDAIEVCKCIYKKDENFKFIKDLLAWCLYEKYFKNNNSINITELENIATFITKIVDGDNDKTPYNKVVLRMINKFKKPFVYDKIIQWLEKVDLSYLSSEPYRVSTKENREVELASNLEEWYYLYCKALYYKKDYKKCLIYKEKAFKDINKFHNSYDIWLNRLEYLCYKNLGELNKAIEGIEVLLNKRELWVCYYDLADVYMLLNENNKAILYLSKALLSNGEDKSKIKAYELMGRVLKNIGRYKEAEMHLLYGKEIRVKENWKIPDNLKEDLKEIDKSYKDKIISLNLKDDLIDIWRKELLNDNRQYGEIITVGPNNRYGFIKGENENYYFRKNSIIDRRFIKQGMKVSYKLKKGFDVKKNKESVEAIEILIMEDI